MVSNGRACVWRDSLSNHLFKLTTMNNIHQSLIAIMNDLGAIGKDKTNPQQGYKFRGIDDMYNALNPLFKKHNVFITSNVIESKREERQTMKGGTLIYTITKCSFTFHAADGSSLESIIEGEAMDSGDKSTNKAMSAALKYALMQMFLIPTEERIDTEYETHEVLPKKKPASTRHEQYRRPTNDVELITELIDTATDPHELAAFMGVNAAFFSSNPELHQRLLAKGKELKQALTTLKN